ncbi:MAG: hypothetical protein RIQ56_298 [Candidatus Parcubacteria bacterium]|jgi:membrane protein DedA with SNARE-associated domain
MGKKSLVLVLIAAVLAGAAIAAEYAYPGWLKVAMQLFEDELLGFIKKHPEKAAAVVGLLAFGESLPAVSLILPFWGVLVGIGVMLPALKLDFTTIMLAAAFGAAAGDWVAYSIGYWFRDWATDRGLLTLEAKEGSSWIARKLVPQIESLISTWWGGIFLITVARFSGPLRAFIPVTVGALRMNWVVFQIANWTSAVLWAWVLLVFGDAFFSYILTPISSLLQQWWQLFGR